MIRGAQTGNDFKVKEYKPGNNKYEYKPYKPSNVGMYGEKENPNKTIKPSPRKQQPKPEPKTIQPTRTQRKLKTFKSYELDSGPDIKIRNTGPDYKVSEYKYRDPDLINRPYVQKPPPEPYKPKYQFENKQVNYKHVDYKLTEQNNLGMRHWHDGFVDDTIMSKRTSGPKSMLVMVPKTPEQKPVAAIKPVSKKEKKPKSPVQEKYVPQAAAAPLPLPPPKKKFADSSTQHVTPGNKTTQTQTQMAPMKTTTIQTDTPQPLPPIVAAGAVMAPSVNKPSKSKSVQATEPQKKVAATGTQYTGPVTKQATMQTSPVVFATQEPLRTHSPELARVIPAEATQRSPEPVVFQRSPSPEATPRMDSRTRNYTPPREWSPVVPVVIPIREASPPTRDYTPPRSKTPPRINTPPRQNTPQRVNSPRRVDTPPRQNTPARVDSPPRWQSPQPWESPIYHLTPDPAVERPVSPPNTFAPVIIPVTQNAPRNQPSSYEPTNNSHRQSPVVRSPSPIGARSPPPFAPVLIPTTQSPDQVARTADSRNQSYARAPPIQRPPSSHYQAPPVAPQRHSPEIPPPTPPRDTVYPQPAHTQAPPVLQSPYFDPQRGASSPPRRPSHPGNRTFQQYAPNKNGRLPPEVNACIEAYDNAHMDTIAGFGQAISTLAEAADKTAPKTDDKQVRSSGESLPSLKRTMRFI